MEDYNLSRQKLCEKLGMRRERLFMEFVSFVKDEDGNPIYENTFQYAILKKEWGRTKNSDKRGSIPRHRAMIHIKSVADTSPSDLNFSRK